MTALHQVEGDAFAALDRMPACWAHGAVLDAPYLLEFMSRDFDRQHRRRDFEDAFADEIDRLDMRPNRRTGRLSDARRMHVWHFAYFRRLFRVLVPGAVGMAFAGSRTYQRQAAAAEDAGFEVLPMVVGITGQAMAQGGDVGKLIDREAGATREVVGEYRNPAGHATRSFTGSEEGDRSAYGKFCPDGTRKLTAPATPLARDFDGRGTRLRDQAMPVAVLMKPTEGSFAANARRWGVAGFDVDGCRVEAAADYQAKCESIIGCDLMRGRSTYRASEQEASMRGNCWSPRGRYPGNVALDAAAAEEVGEMSGERPGRPAKAAVDGTGSGSGSGRSYRTGGSMVAMTGYEDAETSAARYFRRFKYIARAPRSERRRGLETWHWVGSKDHPEGWRRVSVEEWQTIPKRRQMIGSNHPTLKALEFTTWIARLILPPMGPEASRIRMETTGSRARLPVPFSGVGSEAVGGGLAGWSDIVACEMSGPYVAQAACRWAAWGPYSPERAAEVERTGDVRATHAQRGLFEANPL